MLLQSGVVSSTEVASLVAHPDEHIKFRIPMLKLVRMINQQAWQSHALRTWAGCGHLGTAFDEILDQKLDIKWAEKNFMSMIDVLGRTPFTMPVVRYARKNEKGSMYNLYILEF